MAGPDDTPFIEGFEDGVVPSTRAERELMVLYPLDFPALAWRLVVALPWDYFERIMAHPTLPVRGLKSGFGGARARTTTPNAATVSIDIRTVKS